MEMENNSNSAVNVASKRGKSLIPWRDPIKAIHSTCRLSRSCDQLNGDGIGLNRTKFVSEMESFGFAKLDAVKLFVFLRNASEKSLEQWTQEHQDLLSRALLRRSSKET